MAKRFVMLFFLIFFASTCSVLTEEETDFGEDSELRNSIPLDASVAQHLIGNYTATTSSSLFRGQITIIAANSRISMFSYESETYAVFNVGCRNNAVIFEGKTHDPTSPSVGAIRLRIPANQGASDICAAQPPSVPHVRYQGNYGSSRNSLTETITLQYSGPLKSTGSKYLIGHHGCRTVDNCGASENSLESIKYAGYLGANAVEMDVILSKDGIPFLYHDEDFNTRLIHNTSVFCLGDVTNYTMLMIKVFCRLKYGESIPTLREALEALLTDDTIKMIWIDPKTTSAMGSIVGLANEYAAKAVTAGKSLEILIGLPDEDYLNAWLSIPGHETTKCLVEYSASIAMANGCRGFAPRFTLGPQPGDAATLHNSGKVIFYWTVNDKSFFPDYLGYGGADGFISDRTFLLYSYFQK